MTSKIEHSDSAEQTMLPASFRVAFDAAIEHHLGVGGETVLLGGDPLRLLRMSTRTQGVVRGLKAARSLAEAAGSAGVAMGSVEKLARRLLQAGLAHPILEPTVDFSDVMVVLPVKDSPGRLDRALDAIRSSGFGGEIVVVDDGSRESLEQVAARHQTRFIRNTISMGPAAARNQGAARCTTSLIAFIDADCIAGREWLANTLAHFADSQVAIVAPRIVATQSEPTQIGRPQLDGTKPSATQPGATQPTERSALYAYEQVRSPLDLGPMAGPVRPTSRIAYVPAAALIVRRSVFESLGGFDADLHVGEDVDFLWRAVAQGHTIRYEPTATVAHDHRVTWRAFVKRRAQYGTSAAELTERHAGQVPPLVLSPWSAAIWAGLASQTPLAIVSALCTFAYSTAKFPPKLAVLRHPGPLAIRLAVRGHSGAGRQLASATWRTYLPLALAASGISRRARRWTIATALLHNALDYRERKPTLSVARYIGIRLLDDAAYCVGVWQGCVKKRTIGPLVPRIVNWPGRRSVSEDS